MQTRKHVYNTTLLYINLFLNKFVPTKSKGKKKYFLNISFFRIQSFTKPTDTNQFKIERKRAGTEVQSRHPVKWSNYLTMNIKLRIH